MSIYNIPECVSGTGNTGITDCWLDLTHLKGIILVPTDLEVSGSDIATISALTAYLQASAVDTKNDRIYPLINFIGIEDNSEDDVVETSGYGFESPVRDGQYKWNFRYKDGGMCLNSNLHKLAKGNKFKVLLVDNNNQLIGKKTADGTLMGFTIGKFDPKKLKLADGSAPTMYHVEITLPIPSELNEDFMVFKFTNAVETILKGILNVTITTSNPLETSVDVQAQVCGGVIDLYDSFDDELADVSAWEVKNSSGTVVTPSGVTKNATAKTWTIAGTFTAGTYTVSLTTPALLSALGVGGGSENGYESEAVSFVTTS